MISAPETLAILTPLSIVTLTIYFLPTLVAWRRHYDNTRAIFVLNVLCPPTLAALVMLGIAIWRLKVGL